MSDLVIVTGASSNHFGCLRNLLYSISRFEPGTRVIAYDLGLLPEELAELRQLTPDVRRFAYENYPPHLNIRVERGQYAWKPIIIADAVQETRGPVLWLDAGDLVQKKLNRVRTILRTEGFYSPTSQGNIARWTHPKTLEYLQAAPDLLTKPNRCGAVVGFSPARKGIAEFVERWRLCALDVQCIAPPGSSRANHRQDQAVLSVLAYQFQQKCGFAMNDLFLDITSHNDKLSPAEVRRLLLLPKWLRPVWSYLRKNFGARPRLAAGVNASR